MLPPLVRILLPAAIAFVLGMALTPLLTHYLYKFKAWKKRPGKLALDGETAFAEYRLVDHGIILPHTVVPDAFEGRGVGSALARAALGYARREGLKGIPLCPFIASYLKDHEVPGGIVDWPEESDAQESATTGESAG